MNAVIIVFLIMFGFVGIVGGIMLMSLAKGSKDVSEESKPTKYQIGVVLFCIFMFGVMATNLRYLTM